MSEKYKNKYRVKSSRLPNWDYRSNGAYYITICAKKMRHYFGEVSNGEMQLNEIGELAYKYWASIPMHFPFVSLGAFVIMPNHMHGIIIVHTLRIVETLQCNVSTIRNNHMANISPKSGSISTIIRSYKSAVTKSAHLLDADFGWHPRFYDHIIRNKKAFDAISKYIIDNPSNWKGGI